MACDLNAKNRIWNKVPNPSGSRPFELFYANHLQTLAPQCPTHYAPQRNGDTPNSVFQNMSLPATSWTPVTCQSFSTYWIHLELGMFKTELKHLGEEADKAARNLPASTASARRLSTSKLTLLDLNKDLLILDQPLL
jgi:hypothetical protein